MTRIEALDLVNDSMTQGTVSPVDGGHRTTVRRLSIKRDLFEITREELAGA
jgi:hypothetical protein